MKSNIPAPVVAVVIAVVVIVAGLFLWRRASSQSTTDVTAQAAQVNQGKPQTEALPPSLATQGAAMRVRKGGR